MGIDFCYVILVMLVHIDFPTIIALTVLYFGRQLGHMFIFRC